MKQITWYISITVLAACVALGCGATMNKTIAPSPTPNVKFIPADNTIYVSGIRRVAIFPFADYSHQQDALHVDEWGGNIKIQEEIKDHLVAHGLSVTVQEDVNTLLVDQNIIRPIDRERYLIHGTVDDMRNAALNDVTSPEYAFAHHTHTQDMADELLSVISRERRKREPKNTHTPVLQGNTVGLTKDKVVEIAQILDVDLVIRGRIIDYGFKDTETLNPLRRGFVPVVFGGVKDLILGGTGPDGYESGLEEIENIILGATAGYLIGANIDSSKTRRRTGYTGGVVTRRTRTSYRKSDDYGTEGALIGAGAGYMLSQRPKDARRSAVVQVRVYAQNADTGDVMWSNRVEMEYTPRSAFAYSSSHPKVMFDNAVREGVKNLMDSFFVEAETIFSETARQMVPVPKEGV